jgi:phosphonate transport system ATP-binding protein
MNPAIDIQSLKKSFHHRFSKKPDSIALNEINLTIQPGEMVALIGASGSGKSTLIRHISGLVLADKHSHSCIQVNGQTVQQAGALSSNVRDLRAQVSLIFQQFNLVGRLPVITNVLTGMLHRLPLWRTLLQYFKVEEQQLALQALDRVGILHCAQQRASTLSGGQSQRAAIARAIVQKAKIILADEPIASLDPESSRVVMELLTEMNQKDQCTVVVALHQINIAKKYCTRTIALRGGSVVFDGPTNQLTPQLLRDLYGSQVNEILSLSDHISELNITPLRIPHTAFNNTVEPQHAH